MSETGFDLAPVRSLRDFLRATAQVRRLVDGNPNVTAFMRSRAAQRPSKPEARLTSWVSLDRVSPYLICAVIGAEDPVFFQHGGIWWNQVKIALLRAVIMKQPIRAVSTITQQLARNLFLTPNRSILRKLGEALLTWRLETTLTKRRILELYLNVAEWGDGFWGIAAAAGKYCGCAPEDLDAFQSVVLVSLLPAPRTPLSGHNARRAIAVQRRLPRFLYSTGLLSLAEERQVQMCVTGLENALRQGPPRDDAIPRIVSRAPRFGAERQPPTVDALMFDHCGWTRRLRFEEFLREVTEGRASLAARPMWWTDAPTLRMSGDGIGG